MSDLARSSEIRALGVRPSAGDIEAALRGDRDALGRVLAAVAPSMVAALRAIVGAGASDLEDLAQESVAALITSLPNYRGESSFRHFARRVAAHTVLAARRKSRGRARHQPALEQSEHARLRAPDTPADELAAERQKRAVRELLSELPEEQAETLVLRVILGHTIQEIAALTGAPPNTVRSRLRLAKTALRNRIDAAPQVAEQLGARVS